MTASTENVKHASPASGENSQMEQRQRYLSLRLADGYDQIEQAIDSGQDVTRWEDLWMRLLDEYERISDQLTQGRAA